METFLDKYIYNERNVRFAMNGLHLPFLALFAIQLGGDPLLIFFLFMKLVPYNYYNCFHYFVEDNDYFYLKHMVRLTDSGHIASMLFYFNPEYYAPIAHNIHFIITFAYWGCKIVFNMEVNDCYGEEYKIHWVDKYYTILNHTSHYGIVCYYLYSNPELACTIFDDTAIYYTLMWLYTWLFAIYVPWVYFTNDIVYSVLDPIHPWYFRMLVVILVHTIAYASNFIIPCICSSAI
jgi:hypothetical protein